VTSADDERLAQLYRKLRRQNGLSQEEIAIGTGIPLRDVRRLEAGEADKIAFGRIRQLFTQLDARARISVWWKGAALDRLLDEEHAAMVERGAVLIAGYGWAVPTEVTFSEYGERGSIDILAHRKEAMAAAVCEVKSLFGSLEELNRSLDLKVRLAPTICLERFGWRPKHVARLVIVPSVSSTRRVVASHAQTMDELYPARAWEIRRWLRKPDSNLGGIWFLSNPRHATIDSPEDA
jgi:transcriptional regulator with XRE-family HTH domain